jgi:hypothetical protein
MSDSSIKVAHISSRRDFLHRRHTTELGAEPGPAASKTRFLPLESTTIDKLPFDYVQCSLLIPSVVHHLWRHLVAHHLLHSILKDICFADIEYVITATNASSTNDTTNYQQLEFIGDSILKYSVSVHLYAKQVSWPEGYLSKGRDLIVVNSRLSCDSFEIGLDRYIIIDPFTARK